MFQVLTIIIAFEIFGLVFCIICIAISILSPIGTGRHAAALDDIRRELAVLQYPLETEAQEKPCLQVTCFGIFQALYQGKPLPFFYQKTNELLAVMIDKKGAMVSFASIEAIMWEDDNSHLPYLKRLRADLLATAEKLGLKGLILSQRGQIGLNTDLISCDYFDYLAGKPAAVAAYQGVYMEQYSWAEVTNSALYWNRAQNQ